ncbi:MAG TPA: MFS transporter [Firmicutes bacterium]|jgi:MFS family permease|nr:MFS transporter [Bacillota bacterium]
MHSLRLKFSQTLVNYRKLPGSIYVLFFAIMINRMGNFVIPFLAMFLTKNLHYAPDKAGFFIMLVSLAGVPGILLGGSLVDRVGRKNVLALSQFLSACCFVPCALSPNAAFVPWLMVFSVFFSETAQVAHNAMVADLTCRENRKDAFALIYLGINIGFSIGPVLAGFLFNHYIQIFFLIDSLTTMISVALILWFTQETIPCGKTFETPVDEPTGGEQAESGNLWAILWRRPFFLAFLIIYFFYTFVYNQDTFGLPLYLNQLFSGSSSKIYGLLMTTNALFVVCASTLLTVLTRKWSATTNIALAGILYAVGFGMIFFIHSFAMFVLSTVIWTAGEIMSSVNTDVYLTGHSPVSHRGRFNSIRLFIRRAGMAVAPMVMGIFIKHCGLRNVWPIISILALVATAGVYAIHRVERRLGSTSPTTKRSSQSFPH